MALSTFTWLVDVGSGAQPEFRNKTAKFGNGYEQVVGDGLNTVVDKWSISIFGDIANVGPAYDFLLERAGREPFLWTSPISQTAIQVKGTEIRLTGNGATAYTLTATFTQDFSPST